MTALRRRLKDIDPDVLFMAAWALGRIGIDDGECVEDVLHLLSRSTWLGIEDRHRAIRIDMRDDVEDSLQSLLPRVKDPLLDDFRRLFLPGAFHPDAPRPDWLGKTAEHRFFLKVQRARFPRPANRSEKLRRIERMDSAIQQFRILLQRKPTLGMAPVRYRELPGFIKKYTKRIASQIRKAEARSQWLPLTTEPPGTQVLPDVAAEQTEMANLLRELVESELSPEEAAVIRYRYVENCTIEETAAALQLTPSQVKTRTGRALSKLRRRLPPLA